MLNDLTSLKRTISVFSFVWRSQKETTSLWNQWRQYTFNIGVATVPRAVKYSLELNVDVLILIIWILAMVQLHCFSSLSDNNMMF